MSEEPSSYKRIKSRIENLSDLVFGLALSIGSLTLIAHIPTNTNALVTDIAYFGFSFLIVIMIWSGYTRTVTFIPIETEGIFLLNIILLFVVALEPFLFYVLVSTGGNSVTELAFLNSASAAYALDVGVMYLIQAGFDFIVVREERGKHTHSEALILRFRRLGALLSLGGGLFLVSALPFFWVVLGGSYLRFDFWCASIAAFIATRFISWGSITHSNTIEK